MDDREIIQWDKRLTDQARRGWENYKHLHIDLSVARVNQSYLIAGEYLCVENSSSDDAIAKIVLNRINNDALDLEKGVNIETVFIEIFVTNDALQDEWIDLVFGINFKYKKKDEGGGGGMNYVDRGDPFAADWTTGDFTKDGAWHDLDLSGVVPVGAKLVLFRLQVLEPDGYKVTCFKKKGYTNDMNIETRYTHVGAQVYEYTGFVPPDDNGFIEYKFQVATWQLIAMTIRGWFL